MTIGGRLVVPTFGSSAEVGLNPMCIAVPTDDEVPFVFDASMSVSPTAISENIVRSCRERARLLGAQSVAGNKITLAKRLGSTLPPGLIANAEGTPIMDAAPVPDEFM